MLYHGGNHMAPIPLINHKHWVVVVQWRQLYDWLPFVVEPARPVLPEGHFVFFIKLGDNKITGLWRQFWIQDHDIPRVELLEHALALDD